jgi:hypothetical protein
MIDHADTVIDLNAILHPGTVYEHPRDVVADQTISLGEKRAILASWASDAAAVASNPALRHITCMNRPRALLSRHTRRITLTGANSTPVCCRKTANCRQRHMLKHVRSASLSIIANDDAVAAVVSEHRAFANLGGYQWLPS